MGIWLEIHCDLNHADQEWTAKTGRPFCMSWDGDLIGLMTVNANRGYKVLYQNAIEAGWRRTPHGWLCPRCAAVKGAVGLLKARHGAIVEAPAPKPVNVLAFDPSRVPQRKKNGRQDSG